MCGINGFTFANEQLIRRMNKEIRHRGPDDEGIYVDKNISLGNQRLAIIDLSPKGHMPMVDDLRRFVITFNGEIYNFQELRTGLEKRGYRFRSGSDSEVILKLFGEYGEKAFVKLNGMFALAIWDKQEKKLVMVRDRVGIKPLYYTIHRRQLLFSSEIKAFMVHGLNDSLEKNHIDLYMLLGYVPAPYTVYSNIFKVLPGEMVVWKAGKLIKRMFWELPNSEARLTDKARAKEQLFLKTEAAVKRQLVSDRPLGIFLSGGIDSTTVLALATKIRGEPLDTFTIGFSEVAEAEKFNADFELAKKSAHYYGSSHHAFMLSPKQALNDFRELVAKMDEPIANPTHIPTFALARETAKYVTVLLGGDGGDELFYGYDRYFHSWLMDIYRRLPSWLGEGKLEIVVSWLSRDKSLIRRELRAKSNAEKYLLLMGRNQAELKKIYKIEVGGVDKLLSELRGFRDKGEFHQLLPKIDFSHWLPEESLMRSDKMTMLHSLEQRVPLLDNTLIDLASQIPFQWKVGWRLRKKILRETFAGILPTFIVQQPKRGFFSPGAKWLRDKHWQKFLKEIFSRQIVKALGLFDHKGLQRVVGDHLSGKRYNNDLIWSAFFLHSWYANHT
ncbi:asparagine synthase (glutamine-hydrolyzing) [Microgenomates group bacterium RIFCSPLOWO2_01_FULL_46_13]|nr:MAG: asparagine synthase (glutamine-hydrolyzing) [Microgenomates group bacterium RIFCSPLOWO2_01_FULL_46_13]